MSIGNFGQRFTIILTFFLEKKSNKKFKTHRMYPCEEDNPTSLRGTGVFLSPNTQSRLNDASCLRTVSASFE